MGAGHWALSRFSTLDQRLELPKRGRIYSLPGAAHGRTLLKPQGREMSAAAPPNVTVNVGPRRGVYLSQNIAQAPKGAFARRADTLGRWLYCGVLVREVRLVSDPLLLVGDSIFQIFVPMITHAL